MTTQTQPALPAWLEQGWLDGRTFYAWEVEALRLRLPYLAVYEAHRGLWRVLSTHVPDNAQMAAVMGRHTAWQVIESMLRQGAAGAKLHAGEGWRVLLQGQAAPPASVDARGQATGHPARP